MRREIGGTGWNRRRRCNQNIFCEKNLFLINGKNFRKPAKIILPLSRYWTNFTESRLIWGFTNLQVKVGPLKISSVWVKEKKVSRMLYEIVWQNQILILGWWKQLPWNWIGQGQKIILKTVDSKGGNIKLEIRKEQRATGRQGKALLEPMADRRNLRTPKSLTVLLWKGSSTSCHTRQKHRSLQASVTEQPLKTWVTK